MSSARLIALLALSLVLVPLTAQAQPPASPALIDLHFHAERGLSPDKVLQTMDQVGVAVAGNGAKGADNLWESFGLAGASRFLPFAGQGPIGRMVQELAEMAWTLKADPMNSWFLVGTDADDLGQYKDIIDFYRKVLGQLSPEAAQRIGSGNAKRIFRLD